MHHLSHYTSPAFIQQLMQAHHPEQSIQVSQVELLEIDNSASILSVLTAGRSDRPLGHVGLRVRFQDGEREQVRNMVMKIKPHGREIVEMLASLAAACGGELSEVYPSFIHLTGFQHTHMREIDVYKKMPTALHPEIFGLYANDAEEVYIILMEYLQEVSLLNSVMEPEAWTDVHIRQALLQMARWHARCLDKTLPLNNRYWDDVPSAAYMAGLSSLWGALLNNAASKFPELYSPERSKRLRQAIARIPAYWQELEAMPKTLVHNDLNPRNTCFRLVSGELRLCLYDWELATYHVPQYDVVEFLSFVLDEDRYSLRLSYLEFYRQELHRLSGHFADAESITRGFALAALDFGLHRIGMYMMAHSVSPYPFLPRVVNSYFNTLEQIEESQLAAD
jgi:hypothetical protein